jgi:hypothetical protein
LVVEKSDLEKVVEAVGKVLQKELSPSP